ncbi:MAG TPA: tetratricopeptide repeat protein, partial [Terriglobia bacterium]
MFRLTAGAFLLLLAGGLSTGGAQEAPTEGRVQPLDLSDPKAVEQRGDLFMVRKFYPEAVEAYRRLTTLEPNNALFHNKLGIAYHQMQNFNAAKRSYRRAIQLNAQYAEAVNNLAAIEYAEKNYRSAILTYLKALAISPKDPVVYSNLGTAYFAYDKYEYAVACYRYALMIDPGIFERTGRSGSIVHQRDVKDIAAFNFYMAKTYASLNNLEDTLLY